MYEEQFGFSGSPFRLNPDPKFFFGSRSHNKAMAYLHYGLRQGEGFIVITGEIGAGKSMLIGHLLDQLDRSNVIAAHLLTANLEPDALLSHILSAFRIEPAGAGKTAEIEAFEDFLFDQMNRGRRVLLIVDEAQNLPVRTIEELRMLSNMDYEGTPLFQVFLVGQPEFRGVLGKPDMEQFRQRVIASYHLDPIGAEETREYIEHRLSLVGWRRDPDIDADAFAAIFQATGGVPRKINKLCNRILLHASIEKLDLIDAAAVAAVVSDLKGESIERAVAMTKAAAAQDPAPAPLATAVVDEAERDPEIGDLFREDVAAELRASARPGGAPVVIPFGAPRKVTAKPADAAPAEVAAAPADEPAAPARQRSANGKKKGSGGKSAAAAEPDAGGESSAASASVPATEEKPAAAIMAAAVETAVLGAMSMDGEHQTREEKAADPAGPVSALDRLRAMRAGKQAAEPAAEPRQAATLNDVKAAIEAASLTDADRDAALALDADGEPPEDPLALAGDIAAWRRSVVKTIDETRTELKTAYANVARMRRHLADIDQKRRDNRQRIAAGLTRAEALLSEIRNAAG